MAQYKEASWILILLFLSCHGFYADCASAQAAIRGRKTLGIDATTDTETAPVGLTASSRCYEGWNNCRNTGNSGSREGGDGSGYDSGGYGGGGGGGGGGGYSNGGNVSVSPSIGRGWGSTGSGQAGAYGRPGYGSGGGGKGDSYGGNGP